MEDHSLKTATTADGRGPPHLICSLPASQPVTSTAERYLSCVVHVFRLTSRLFDSKARPPLDYEDAAQRDGFRLRIRVSDGLHDTTSNVVVQLRDENDHAPDIVGPSEVQISEDAPRNTVVARFSVTDRDRDDRAR
ncbi:unnamed protein product [Heligmosomoides polygyrus]|uniref:CA domain-containing protein n=1 Tax=Heligmosomoides polygyrus TaxID=6339 RepID=A0A183FKB6_HELPZ|nr:unnamed protein product [Heligmosomoides polygyrus]